MPVRKPNKVGSADNKDHANICGGVTDATKTTEADHHSRNDSTPYYNNVTQKNVDINMDTQLDSSTMCHAYENPALDYTEETDIDKEVSGMNDESSVARQIENQGSTKMTTVILQERTDSSDPSPSPTVEGLASLNGVASTSDVSHRRDNSWLDQFESALRSSASSGRYVTRDEVKESLLHFKQSFFVDRLVDIAGIKSDGRIDVNILIGQLRSLIYGSQTDKLRVLFNVYDSAGNGRIDRKGLQEFFTSVIKECNLDIDGENVQELIDTFLHTADKDNDGQISFEELQFLFQRRPSIINNMTIRHHSNLNGEIKERSYCRHFSKNYIRNNLRKAVALVVYSFINVFLMGLAVYLYWDNNSWIKAARAFGQALNFNCALVLVLMLRCTLTWLRNTPLRHVLPFDQHIYFHRLCGYFIAILTVGHTTGHVGNCLGVADSLNMTAPEILFTTKAGVGWIGHSAYVTGNILVVVLMVMVILSLPVIRRSGFFEVFYWSHKLYWVFWILLIIHGPNFWKWFIVPGTAFIIELVIRHPWFRMFSLGKTYIEQVSLLPSGVTHLVISRPSGFHFKPGDYVFIQVPDVAKYETHPFTISSAPENMEEIWLHIRSAGHWTKSLNKFFTDYKSDDVETGKTPETSPSEPDDVPKYPTRRRASSVPWLKSRSLKATKKRTSIHNRVITKKVRVLVHIDGPYGTASRQIFEQEQAILIGSGIGITPMASIIQSIVSRYKASCVQCPRCSHKWCHQPPSSFMTLKKVDCVWINRDQRQFEWFASMLVRLEREQEVEGSLGGILDMHMYMTSLPAKADMRGMGLQLALDLVREDDNRDLLTGLRTRTQGGRPNFDELFSKIKAKSEGRRVKVFFCGSPLLGTTIKLYSSKYDFGFAHEYF